MLMRILLRDIAQAWAGDARHVVWMHRGQIGNGTVDNLCWVKGCSMLRYSTDRALTIVTVCVPSSSVLFVKI